MRLAAILAVLIGCAGAASADTARVRAVELGDVTRIAIEFTKRPDWQVGRTAEGYAIRFPSGQVTAVDIGARVGGTVVRRVTGIRPAAEGRGIDIEIGCACTAQIQEFRDTSIVIDVSADGAGTGPPDRPGGTVTGDRPPHVLTGVPDLVPPPPVEVSGARAPVSADGGPGRPARQAMPTLPAADAPVRSVIPVLTTGSSPDPAFASLAELAFASRDSHAVDMLSRELSRAIAQGLVDAPDLDRPVPAPPAGPMAADRLQDGQSNLTITTAIDRDVRANRDRPLPTLTGSVCLADSEFEIASWGDPTDRKVLGRLRTAAFDETGQPSASGMLALVRHYLAMGFGAEAKALTAFIGDDARRELLVAMAEIVDHGESRRHVLDGQVFCKGKVALWSLLAHDVDIDDRPADTDHILSAFSELPLHIRIHLGPVLSKRLQNLGFDAEAQIALNAVTRGGGHTPAQDLTAARLGLSGTTPETARNDLRNLSRGTDRIAAEALLELLLDAERRGVPPDPAWVADAPSLVRATRGTDTAAALNLAGFRGRIALGQFDSLREALNEWSPGLTVDTRRDLASAAIGAAGGTADDATFVRAELAFAKVADTALIPKPRQLQVAERLIALGLYDRALRYLSDAPDTDQERLLAAAALGGLNRVDAAIAILEGSETPEALRALGELYLDANRAAEAIDAFARASEIERASQAAIGSGNWAWLKSHPDETLSAAARDLSGGSPDPELGGAQGNVGLLERAALRRRHADMLLQRTALGNEGSAFTN